MSFLSAMSYLELCFLGFAMSHELSAMSFLSAMSSFELCFEFPISNELSAMS